jgi:large subunit ribosomal protein L21
MAPDNLDGEAGKWRNDSMYAIFETGGKQYKVQAGDKLKVEKLAGEAGDKIKFEKVIAYSDGSALQTGTPYLDGATVNATIVTSGKGEKIIIFKFKSKKDYRKKQGHRQPYTEIEIDGFTVGGKTVGEKPVKKAAPKAKKDDTVAEKDEKVDSRVKPENDKVESENDKVVEKAADDKVVEKAEKVDSRVKPENVKVEEKPAAEGKQTKADIMAKLDALGATYKKSATKDELLAALAEAEAK